MRNRIGILANLSAALMGLFGPHQAIRGLSGQKAPLDMVQVGPRFGKRFRKKSGGQKSAKRRPHKNMKYIGRSSLHAKSSTSGWVFFRP